MRFTSFINSVVLLIFLVHFDAAQWEVVRCDGKRKLKHDAVLTIFNFSFNKPIRKPPTERSSLEKILLNRMIMKI